MQDKKDKNPAALYFSAKEMFKNPGCLGGGGGMVSSKVDFNIRNMNQ